MRVLSRIYNHLFSPASLINIIEENKIKGMSVDSSELYKFATLKTERNMKATILAYEELLAKYPTKRPLFIFENTTQCEYTSSHAATGEFFFDVDEYNRSFANGAAEIKKFEHILRILNTQNTSLSDFYGKINLNKNDAFKALAELSYNDAKFLEEDIIVHLCPTKKSSECFARMINGYFVDDLQPHQSYALINFVCSFAYEFIGIGANLMLFYKQNPLEKNRAKELFVELEKLYALNEKQLQEAIGFLVESKKYLLLPYTNSFSDTKSTQTQSIK
ncbi:hypothetical protein [Campylobacter suis]|uniref:DUF5644 domain-containing protein n=1 Tax=Campylobacter suis TaxID=2790657 RepID=A0ABM8Q1S0_9BACT|nr:hypothetical protein [Campylobacter suis]CAD7286714.1 hypothetical protein LMG8286_00500 [Campylobacter suis]